jgi:hypothetical protein
MATLDTRTDLIAGAQRQEPISLRRRFLLWRLRG